MKGNNVAGSERYIYALDVDSACKICNEEESKCLFLTGIYY